MCGLCTPAMYYLMPSLSIHWMKKNQTVKSLLSFVSCNPYYVWFVYISYVLSHAVVVNSLDEEEPNSADISERHRLMEKLIRRLRRPAEITRLDDLDLVAYAAHMEEDGSGI